MANYTINLTPALINLATEGSLDTSIVEGCSLQRTAYLETVDSTGGRKVLELVDCEEFDDVPQTPTEYSNGAGGNWIS